jgi:replicative DNA helicase
MDAEKGLPANLDAERVVLGSILLDDQQYELVAGSLTPDDFSLEKHRRIFRRMGELHDLGERIDRITLANELMKFGELEACDGFSYLVSLDDGLPQISNVDSYVRIVLEKSVLRRTIFAAQHLMNRCLAAEESASEILLTCQKTLDALADSRHRHGEWVTPVEVITHYPGGVPAFVTRKRGGVGIETPWLPVTETLGGGLHKGELFITAGRPSMGKSVVGMQIAHRAAADGHTVAVISLEMSKEALVERLLCGIAAVDCQKLRAGYLNVKERQKLLTAAADIEALPLSIHETRARTIPAITAALRKLAAKHPVDLIVLDHLQLMTSTGRRREQTRHEELSEILHELKHTAVKMNASVVVLSQLNRQCEIENRPPQLSDLKETGAAEEDADVVMFVHRPERYAKNHDRAELRGLAEFIIAKQRCGPVGKKDMVFLSGIQRFELSLAISETSGTF